MENKPGEEGAKRRIGLVCLLLAAFLLLLPGCGAGYGGTEDSGGGPATHFYIDGAAGIAGVVDSWSGVWFSSYGGRRLDGYRIGKWKDRHSLLPREKLSLLFPGFDPDAPRFLNYSGMAYDAANDFPRGSDYPDGLEDAYFILYDDTVYESEPGDGGNGGWGDLHMRYLGIVKAVNLFSESGTGAVILHYLEGCFPNWDEDFIGPPPHCYFGLYYRIRDDGAMYLANAVDLASMYAGEKYYTETATLSAAAAKNSAENGKGFISWGVVMVQEREQ